MQTLAVPNRDRQHGERQLSAGTRHSPKSGVMPTALSAWNPPSEFLLPNTGRKMSIDFTPGVRFSVAGGGLRCG